MLCITFRCRIRFLLCNKSVHVTECVFNGLKNIKCRNNKINEKNLFSYSREWHVLFLILAKIAWNFFHYDKPNIHSMNRKTATVAYTAHRLIFIFHHYYPAILISFAFIKVRLICSALRFEMSTFSCCVCVFYIQYLFTARRMCECVFMK